MDELISRQAVIDAILTELTKRERKSLLHTWSTVEVKYFITEMLEQLPSASVVRCKDCKYGSPNGKYGCSVYHYKKYETHDMKPNDYCSMGERKDDETERA